MEKAKIRPFATLNPVTNLDKIGMTDDVVDITGHAKLCHAPLRVFTPCIREFLYYLG